DAAESGGGVGLIRELVGFARAGCYGNTARVGVLDDDARRLCEALHALKGSVSVSDVVERQFLALQLDGAGNAGFGDVVLNIECCLLVRVFAVAKTLLQTELAVPGTREARCARSLLAEIVGNGAIVTCGVFESGKSELEARGGADGAVAFLQFADDL